MKRPKSCTKKQMLLFSLITILSFPLVAQKNHKIWEALLQNKREDALELVQKLNTKNDIENAILKKLVEMDNGIMKYDPDFVKKINGYTAFENYLYPHWRMPYMFGDYVKNGFTQKTYEVPHVLDPEQLQNSTVKNGLYYIQAITKRHEHQWDVYADKLSNISAIRKWEYCGVFENLNSSGIDMPYPPEDEVSPDVVFDAQSKGDAKWYMPREDKEVYKFFGNHGEFGSGVHYAQTFIHSEKDQRVRLKIGKGGLIRISVNDVTVLEEDEAYITELDAYTYEVNLQQGVNRILVKSAAVGSSAYFIVRLEDLQGNPITNYKTSFTDRKYTKGTLASVNPKRIKHPIEQYFEDKIKDSKSDPNLSKLSLYLTHYRNGQIQEALDTLKEWAEAYPKSSFIKMFLMDCYSLMGDQNLVDKIKNNMIRRDPAYYLSYVYEYSDFQGLMKLDLQAFKTKLTKIKEATDLSYMKTSIDFMIALRENNRVLTREQLDKLVEDNSFSASLKTSFIEFYSRLFNDDQATIQKLEEVHQKEFNSKIQQYLAYYYKKQNRIEDVLSLYIKNLEHINEDNDTHYTIIKLLHDIGQFERSLPFIDTALENFPNSYVFTKLKGNALVQLKKKKEAIELYELALRRYPSDRDLRAKINDLKSAKNPLDEFHLEDAYDYMDAHRNTIKKNNYGVNVLLSQTDMLCHKNGGGAYKTTLIYEITAQNGIDIFKEYNLGLSGDYLIHKAESYKVNGDIVPAEKSGSSLVFDELEIGDVVYLDYESRYTKRGRFYKDYILTHTFGGYHPTVKNMYRVLTHDKKVNHEITNGTVDYNTYKKGDLYVHEWSVSNNAGIPVTESFMPAFTDVTTKLHISSITSWDKIANWYSDIVRKQLKDDKVIEETFSAIFPKGYTALSEEERAKKIYYYITNNLNYSHVSFKQGSFVPQKPAKTIQTKLGDCKDFSSLFLVLAKKAGLDTKLVLILTADYGNSELLLPSTDFNHCIVKVTIDGKPQFLELTDKYLPFRSLPMSLRGAAALEIPYESSGNENSTLFRLNKEPRQESIFRSNYVLDVNEEISDINLESKVSGHLASYYIEMFKTNEEKVLEETVQQEISDRCSALVKTVKLGDFKHNQDSGEINYKTSIKTDLKINKVGDVFTFKVPYFLNPYNNSIIKDESRSYPIDYTQYENSDGYEELMTIRLQEHQKFVDLPKNLEYRYKEHTFSIKYDLVSPKELNIKISSKVNTDMISTQDYDEFKTYVDNVLDSRDVLLKFQS